MEGEQVQQPTPVQQPIVNKSQEQPKPKNTPKILTTFLIIVTVLLLCLSGYLAYQNYILRKQISQVQFIPVSTVTTPLPTTNHVAGWKTLSNEYGFSIKYPSSLRVLGAGREVDETNAPDVIIAAKPGDVEDTEYQVR